jgi:hypothetical protein
LWHRIASWLESNFTKKSRFYVVSEPLGVSAKNIEIRDEAGRGYAASARQTRTTVGATKIKEAAPIPTQPQWAFRDLTLMDRMNGDLCAIVVGAAACRSDALTPVTYSAVIVALLPFKFMDSGHTRAKP